MHCSKCYVIIINFIGVSNINKTEATITEIVFFAVLVKISNDQNWEGTASVQDPNSNRE